MHRLVSDWRFLAGFASELAAGIDRGREQVFDEADARQQDQARDTKAERGYGRDFQQERRRWRRILAVRSWPCARCRQPIHPGQPRHLDHTDDRTDLLGPSHAACNTSAGGKAAHS